MWLDRRVDITIDLIHWITRLSKNEVGPVAHFIGKDQDRKLVAQLIKKYNLTRGGWAYDVAQIKDKLLQFTIQLLARQVLQKCRSNQVPGPAIELADTGRDGV